MRAAGETGAALAEGLPMLRLETGDKLAAAVSLYEDSGFTRRPPFGAYEDSPSSITVKI